MGLNDVYTTGLGHCFEVHDYFFFFFFTNQDLFKNSNSDILLIFDKENSVGKL